MSLDRERARRCLQAADLETLFIEELGWDHQQGQLSVTVDGATYTLSAIAEKRGLIAYRCDLPAGQDLPGRPARIKIERQVAKRARQHLIVFLRADGESQVWQWARRDPGQPLRHHEQPYESRQTGEALLQMLQRLAFSLDEEEGLTHVDVTSRVRAAFDVERVTKRFYDRFKKERDALARFLQGIPDGEMQAWYVSVLLNRLMFIYFIQKRGFLDGDPDYLRHKLMQSQARGANRYYREFLCPLFFAGLARRQEERSAEANRLLGRIPYLDGGLFQRHQVEERYGQAIQIPDAAFARLFAFFEAYQWHLDERSLRKDDEINPDVLGYIFEKYINQKQMGAYYTKEDITEYIAKNTLIPFLLDQARAGCRVAFEGERSVWQLLQEDPDRYIYEALRKGVELPLPPEIAAGLHDLSQRGPWNTPAPEEYALPTEIWREVVARRRRYEEVRLRMAGGEVRAVNDLITYNLDIRQFAQDAIEQCEGPELLRAFWRAMEKVTVLDPTCGSGAFLFAALNILQPLYGDCLGRMEQLVREADEVGSKKYPDLRALLQRVAQHPSRDYFVCKTIVVNNLYGVDIMDEAVEICKLRLFLKLVAQVERVEEIEPLPDIDFNIKAGNTLVGFTGLEQVERALTTGADGQMLLPMLEIQTQLARIAERAEIAARAYDQFRQRQLLGNGAISPEDKENLGAGLKKLDHELDRALARTYDVDPDSLQYDPWLRSHKPFHWFTHFYAIMQRGGFDVIIGNPPYVEYGKVRKAYTIPDGVYRSDSVENLYGYCMERSAVLLQRRGVFGMIVPAAVLGLDKALSLREVLLQRYAQTHCSTYGIRPSKLFDGVDQRLCIYLGRADTDGCRAVLTTRHHVWSAQERPTLFSLLAYEPSFVHMGMRRVPQIGSPIARRIMEKIEAERPLLSSFYARPRGGHIMHYHRSPRYWIRAMNFEPYFQSPGRSRSVFHFRDLHLATRRAAYVVGALLNSSLFFLWFVALGNGRNITAREIDMFPIGDVNHQSLDHLEDILMQLMADYQENSFIRRRADCEFQEFRPGQSKSIIDGIDRVLARHFGFTDEELDFIVNYDIKYRLGL